MPSLKDLRNRIASVKATQKITKAMQMVAAAKLRRAQEAAEAARPYSAAHGRGAGQHRPGRRRRRRCAGADDRHRQGRRPPARRLHRRARPVRRLQLARSRASRATISAACWPSGKTVKIICVGKKGYDILRRDFASLIIDARRPARGASQLGFVNADAIAREGHRAVRAKASSTSRRCSIREFKSVITPDPDRAAAHPGRSSRPRRRREPAAAPSTNTSRSRARSSPTSSRATSRCRSSARCSRTRPARWAPR